MRLQSVAAGELGAVVEGVMTEWQQFVQNQQRTNTKPKLICIDLQPATTTQAPDRNDILNIGGFSDAVFSVVAAFLADDANRFVTEVIVLIEKPKRRCVGRVSGRRVHDEKRAVEAST